MNQTTLGFDPLHKKIRKEAFLEEMARVVLWAELVALIARHARGAHQALGGRPPFAVETMLHIHCLQLWWNLSDPAMEEESQERPLYRQFSRLEEAALQPDETTILRFRHLLEKQQLAPQMLRIINEGLSSKGLLLKTGTLVDASLIAVRSATKNSSGERDPEMHQTKKGNQWHFARRHTSVSMLRAVWCTPSLARPPKPMTSPRAMPCCMVKRKWCADGGYQGADKREDATCMAWHIAMRPGKRQQQKHTPWGELLDKVEQLKASVRAKVEHPFRVIKQQFGCAKVRYRGLAKNTARLTMLFALGNLWMVR